MALVLIFSTAESKLRSMTYIWDKTSENFLGLKSLEMEFFPKCLKICWCLVAVRFRSWEGEEESVHKSLITRWVSHQWWSWITWAVFIYASQTNMLSPTLNQNNLFTVFIELHIFFFLTFLPPLFPSTLHLVPQASNLLRRSCPFFLPRWIHVWLPWGPLCCQNSLGLKTVSWLSFALYLIK